jgi:hypothetical protein
MNLFGVPKSPGPDGRGFFSLRGQRLLGFLIGILVLSGCERATTTKLDPTPVTKASPPMAEDGPRTSLLWQNETTNTITLERTSAGIRVIPPWPGSEVWRGHSAFELYGREVCVRLDGGEVLVDSPVPDGTTLHYLAKNNDGRFAAATIDTPPVKLPTVRRPRLVVDKLRYVLMVLDGDTVVKTYAVGLGSQPVQRKICQDNMTTPEGVYSVYNLQPNATFYKAFDIDYPNEVDRLRYQIGQDKGLVGSDRGIGGEIQMHGRGSLGNWTFGCISLDDDDMDELFQHTELAAGMEIFICGSEIKLEDRPWLLHPPAEKVRHLQAALQKSGHYNGAVDGQLGPGTQESLGRYQAAKGLPLTCQLDSATREHFKL